jgi:transcriptional regulator with XRE-family HTH domain
MGRKRKKDTIEFFLEQVGDNIRHYRLKRGLTLEALGEDIGLDKSNMFRIEQGKNITLLTLLKVAAFLDVHPSKLFSGTPEIVMEDAEEYIRQK